MLGLNRSLRSAPLVPLLAVLASVAAPGEAEACSPDICFESNRFTGFELASTRITPEGVLVFRLSRYEYSLTLEEALAYVEVQVLDSQGLPVAGSLEILDGSTVLWRPAAPLQADTEHEVSLRVDNETLGLENDPEWVNQEGQCGEDIELLTSFVSTSGSFSALEPTVDDSRELIYSPVQTLDTVVCCDGAMPSEENWCGDWTEIYWSEGFCTADTQLGRFTATFDVALDTADGELDNLMLRLHTGAETRTMPPGTLSISRSDDAPFCSVVEVVNVATGSSVSVDERCVGDDLADQLGPQLAEIAEVLAQECAGEPYVCEIDVDRWDPEQCTAWTEPEGEDEGGSEGGDGSDGGDDGSGSDGGGDGGLGDDGIADRGCGCRADADGSPAGLAWGLLGLVLWRRRRRA